MMSCRSRSTCFVAEISFLILLGSSLGLPGPVIPAAERPAAITVDDLPLALGSLHPEPSDRERITRELGNHGFSHLDYTRTDPERFIADASM